MTLKTKSKARARAPMLCMLAISALATGCGGGGSDSTPQNSAPKVSAISSQSIDQGMSTAALPFTVNDSGGADAVTLTTFSSNATIVPVSGIVLGGSGASRTLTVTPDPDGTGDVNVTIKATNAQGLATSISVPVSVKPVVKQISAYATTTFAQMENDTPAQVSGFTFQQDTDSETAFDAQLQ